VEQTIMDFDATDFLTGLFGGAPAPSGMDRDAGPQVSDNAPALEETAGGPTAPADAPEPVPALPGDQDAGPAPFPGWILRPDIAGRLGWEPPGLPEDRRWWARSTFDDLPMFPRQAARPGAGPCGWCGRSEWWRSTAWPDVVRCGWCSPPASGAAVEWLRGGGPQNSN